MAKPFRIGVLGSADSWYMRDLIRASQLNASVQIIPLAFDSLQTSSVSEMSVFAREAKPAEPQNGIHSPELVDLKSLRAIVVRTMPLGSLEQVIFRMNALQVAEQLGVPVYNSPRCLEVCIDKWLTLQKAQSSGLLIPKTICCQSRNDAMIAWEQLGKDCVVKPIFGGEGRGIVRVSDVDMAWRVFSTLEHMRSVFYLQEFIPNDGYDLRLLVVDDTLYCIRREAGSNWRANVSQGGVAVPFDPTFEQAEIAFRAARAVGGWMVGVDLIESSSGENILIEVNAVPGWKATAKTLGHDIARTAINKIMEIYVSNL